MKTRLTLRPGDNGTKKLLAKYGDRLLAVRFRYDPDRRRRFKTVELIEEELPWDPGPPPAMKPDTPVLVQIDYTETELRQRAKSAGALWQQQRKLWQMSYAAARALGLESRIVSCSVHLYIQAPGVSICRWMSIPVATILIRLFGVELNRCRGSLFGLKLSAVLMPSSRRC